MEHRKLGYGGPETMVKIGEIYSLRSLEVEVDPSFHGVEAVFLMHFS